MVSMLCEVPKDIPIITEWTTIPSSNTLHMKKKMNNN